MWYFDCQDHWYGSNVIDGKDDRISGQEILEAVDHKSNTMRRRNEDSVEELEVAGDLAIVLTKRAVSEVD